MTPTANDNPHNFWRVTMRRSTAAVKTPFAASASAVVEKKSRKKGLSRIYLVFPFVLALAVAVNYSFLPTTKAQQPTGNAATGTAAQSLSIPSKSQSTVAVREQKIPELLVQSPNTIVTAYFQIRSKYQKETYMEWMSVMLSLQDPMIIFTTADWVEPIMSLRKHALNRTHIITMELKDVPMAKDYSTDYWQHQLDIDPEKKRHAGFQVFWIWLSKTWFVTEGIRLNPYQSDVFMWSDIGCFRGAAANRYANQVLMQHTDVIPEKRILFLSHKDPIEPPSSVWWNNKLKEKEHFYHSGSQMLGHKTVWDQYHAAFVKTFTGFNERQLFIGDDQPVFQCTCLQNPHLCAYVPRSQVKDNHYFGLRYVVFHGGKFNYWYPPEVGDGR